MGLSKEKVQSRVKEAIELVNIFGLEERSPHHLSGGQKKLVAIAGILAMKPEVIVLDEPTAGLDPFSASEIMKVMDKMNRELGITVILSSHDVDIIPLFAERVYVLHHGRLEAEGTAKEIFKDKDLVEQAHLRMPRIADIFKLLQDEGLDVEIKITPDDAKDEILRLIRTSKNSHNE